MSFTFKELEEPDLEQIKQWFPKVRFTVEYNYNNNTFIMPEKYAEVLPGVLDLEVRSDDVWVSSFPRTGSTWCQEIVWLLMNDLDFEASKSSLQFERAPNISMSAYAPSVLSGDAVKYIQNMKSPRCIKCHEPYGFLPKQVETVKPKIIYVIRNPKDVYCSFHAYLRTFRDIQATFEEAADFFCRGKLPNGSYLNHCLSYWNKRHEPNVYIVSYESMLKDTKKAIRNIAAFLEKSLTDEQVDQLDEFVAFNSMKQHPGINLQLYNKNISELYVNGKEPFIRQGKCGTWTQKFSADLSKKFDEWIDRETRGTGLTFDYGTD